MKIATVIPAFNEEQTVGGVVRVVRSVPELDEVIVVCDGCTDSTAEVAQQEGATVVVLQENRGKGAAMLVGVAQTSAEVIIFIDADLIGLRPKHLRTLAQPVLSGTADMTVGIFANGRLATDLAQLVAPYLSGQRGLRKALISQIDNMEVARYGIEVALTNYARRNGWRVQNVELADLTHIMKEEKLGLVKGFGARMKMYWEIAKCLTQW